MMRSLLLVLMINLILVTCHRIERRQTDDDGDIQLTDWDWEAGPPHYEHFHYTTGTEEGEIDFAPRIIGGTPAWHGEFPAKISIQNRNGHHFCGGALIDPRHVLTAAHCLTTDFGAVFHPDSVRLMGDDLSIQRWGSEMRQLRFATHLFVHPSFNVRTYSADIAVIRAGSPFMRTTNFHPLPRSFSTPLDAMNCNLAGWGVTSETNTRPHPILLRVELDIINMNFCNGTQSYQGSIPIATICAGSMDGSRDACFGDSGGGLICNEQIAGIVSFGFGCGRRNFPGIYTDVSQFNHWIQMSIDSNIPNQDIPRPPMFEPSSVAGLLSSTKLIIVLVLATKILSQ